MAITRKSKTASAAPGLPRLQEHAEPQPAGRCLDAARQADARWRYDRQSRFQQRANGLAQQLSWVETQTRRQSLRLLGVAFVLVHLWLLLKTFQGEAWITAATGWSAAAAVAALAIVPTGGPIWQALLRRRLRKLREWGRHEGIEVDP